MMSYHIVSIGGNCQPAHQIRRHTGKTEANVFDWLMIELRDVARLIDNDFVEFLELSNLQYVRTPFRHVLDQASLAKFVHDFKFSLEPRDQYENVRSKYDYLIKRWRETMERDETIVFVWLGAATDRDLHLLEQSISIRRKSKPFLIAALTTGLPPGRKSARIVCFDIAQPDPYVWKGDDMEWEAVLQTLPAELQAAAAATTNHGPIGTETLGRPKVFDPLEDAIRERASR
ncbi:DUF1796 family putative cysteine peptidase [Methylorubrum salsuginis]|uniref:Putative papain-like cysteine peptidase n=1 Tax=Methylorubrum salsuginis TaxID=414703 RepID=A0A1I4ECR8_9HYPH|nr:DUF1796 family putative cysteine peptidase [Methylorubrum salsuginis]SFL02999.1 Putative papain-like cysteine peptidase [Methylorubrum salsuginis]